MCGDLRPASPPAILPPWLPPEIHNLASYLYADLAAFFFSYFLHQFANLSLTSPLLPWEVDPSPVRKIIRYVVLRGLIDCHLCQFDKVFFVLPVPTVLSCACLAVYLSYSLLLLAILEPIQLYQPRNLFFYGRWRGGYSNINSDRLVGVLRRQQSPHPYSCIPTGRAMDGAEFEVTTLVTAG